MQNALSGKHKAVLLGPFDRFNYGDLLFPIVAQNEIAKHSPGTQTSIHSLFESNLSNFGARKTSAIGTLYRPGALQAGDAVIFAGGGTIGVDWAYMYSNMLSSSGNQALYYLKRILGDNATNKLCRHLCGGRTPHPWIAEPDDFPAAVKVGYNSVGGSEFSYLPSSVQAQILDRLGKAAYLSVRDSETKRLFASLEDELAVELAPDSAILMSEQFPISFLVKNASAQLNALIESCPYICFQGYQGYIKKNENLIVATIESIFEQYGLRAVLLPIGRYVSLDDYFALRNLKEKIRTPAELISDDTSIWEVMLVIAKAALFLGTSLHGNVTSQSFAVPNPRDLALLHIWRTLRQNGGTGLQ